MYWLCYSEEQAGSEYYRIPKIISFPK